MSRTGRWSLQDAKARFSEVVRKAKTEGPRRITVSVEEYRRAKGEKTGQALVKLLHDSPLREIDMDRARAKSRVRKVEL